MFAWVKKMLRGMVFWRSGSKNAERDRLESILRRTEHRSRELIDKYTREAERERGANIRRG